MPTNRRRVNKLIHAEAIFPLEFGVTALPGKVPGTSLFRRSAGSKLSSDSLLAEFVLQVSKIRMKYGIFF